MITVTIILPYKRHQYSLIICSSCSTCSSEVHDNRHEYQVKEVKTNISDYIRGKRFAPKITWES